MRVVREDPSNENLLFAGTEFGLFASFDRGRHWISLRGDSLPAVQVHDLQIHPRDRDLVAATHGRSIFILDDITGLEQMTPEAMAKPLVLFAPHPARGFYIMAMTWRVRVSVVLAACIAGAACVALAADALQSERSRTPWKIVGQLEEACTCAAAGPCWLYSKPTHMTCGGGQFLFIEKGNYGDVALDGLAVGNMAESPEGRGMMESFGAWKYSHLYVDERATAKQREALLAVANQVLPVAASPKKEIRYVPISRTISGKDHTITMGP